jgi:hypothetical protein
MGASREVGRLRIVHPGGFLGCGHGAYLAYDLELLDGIGPCLEHQMCIHVVNDLV